MKKIYNSYKKKQHFLQILIRRMTKGEELPGAAKKRDEKLVKRLDKRSFPVYFKNTIGCINIVKEYRMKSRLFSRSDASFFTLIELLVDTTCF